MAPEDEINSGTNAGAPTETRPPGPARRGRRGGRGRRGRGRPRPQPPETAGEPAREAPGWDQPPPVEEGPQPNEAVQERAGEFETRPAPEHEAAPDEPRSLASSEDVAPVPAPRPRQPAEPATVQKAIDEVSHIIRTLREALDDMEDVMEILELAERQKNADEREIESLRRALRPLHRHGEGGQSRRERG